MQGFLVFSYAKEFAAARAELAKLVQEGKIKPITTEFDGLEQAPAAFVELLRGKTRGTPVVRVSA